MNWETYTIKDLINEINNDKIVLPSLQRKYVWKPKQIENLFDSLMQGFPIGTFFFWRVSHKKLIGNMKFYEFFRQFNPKENENQDITKKIINKRNIVSVIDGQQRITSLYIALSGHYVIKKYKGRSSKKENFQENHIYYNVMSSYSNRNKKEGNKFEFKFFPSDPMKNFTKSSKKVWVRLDSLIHHKSVVTFRKTVRKKLLNTESSDQKNFIKNHWESKGNLKQKLTDLWDMYNSESISYFTLQNTDLNDIVEIFIRVNNAGTQLSRTEMLMSTVSAYWPEARDKVDKLLKTINDKGFDFGVDFVMRSALVSFEGNVLYNPSSVSNIVKKIEEDWDKLQNSIIEATEMLKRYKYDAKSLTSKNAAIPLVYFVFKGGSIQGSSKEKNQQEEQIKLYLRTALVTGMFGTHGDQALTAMRESMRKEVKEGVYELRSKRFSYQKIAKHFSVQGKVKIVDRDYITKNILKLQYGNSAFPALVILFEGFPFNSEEFNQDHIFPKSSFMFENEEEFFEANSIVNLQILNARDNKIKQDIMPEEWIQGLKDKNKVQSENYLPSNIKNEEFSDFYTKRYKILLKKFEEAFHIKDI